MLVLIRVWFGLGGVSVLKFGLVVVFGFSWRYILVIPYWCWLLCLRFGLGGVCVGLFCWLFMV